MNFSYFNQTQSDMLLELMFLVDVGWTRQYSDYFGYLPFGSSHIKWGARHHRTCPWFWMQLHLYIIFTNLVVFLFSSHVNSHQRHCEPFPCSLLKYVPVICASCLKFCFFTLLQFPSPESSKIWLNDYFYYCRLHSYGKHCGKNRMLQS